MFWSQVSVFNYYVLNIQYLPVYNIHFEINIFLKTKQ